MPKQEIKIPADKLHAYKKVITAVPEIKRKGKSSPYTSVNGHMFSYLSVNGTMGLRLNGPDQEAFVNKYKTGPFIQYGAVMKEYVTVPEALLKKPVSLKKYVQMSFAYASSLKPKPTTKPAVKVSKN